MAWAISSRRIQSIPIIAGSPFPSGIMSNAGLLLTANRDAAIPLMLRYLIPIVWRTEFATGAWTVTGTKASCELSKRRCRNERQAQRHPAQLSTHQAARRDTFSITQSLPVSCSANRVTGINQRVIPILKPRIDAASRCSPDTAGLHGSRQTPRHELRSIPAHRLARRRTGIAAAA